MARISADIYSSVSIYICNSVLSAKKPDEYIIVNIVKAIKWGTILCTSCLPLNFLHDRNSHQNMVNNYVSVSDWWEYQYRLMPEAQSVQ
jgi:hypothetical protein